MKLRVLRFENRPRDYRGVKLRGSHRLRGRQWRLSLVGCPR